MNRIVRAWHRQATRTGHAGPDTVTIDDETFQLTEEEMPQIKLEEDQFNAMIRMVKRLDVDRLPPLRNATYHALKRLGRKRNVAKAVEGLPSGNDQVNGGLMLSWLDSVKPKPEPDKADRKDFNQAVKQVVALDATLTRRVKGG